MTDQALLDAQERIRALEAELEQMTGALAHAWDQLVPFLQSTPKQVDSTRDVIPILESIMAAVDAPMGAVYLVPRSGGKPEWIIVPANAVEPLIFQKHLSDLRLHPETLRVRDVPGWSGKLTHWLFVPILVSNEAVGTIGVGLIQDGREFNAGEVRILSRMTERAAAQIVEANLAESQARERQAAHEIQIAGLIQRSIQPADEPCVPGLQVAAHWQPALNVGGDAWGWVLQPSGKLAFFILDVAGKGIPGALGAVSLHTAFKMALRLDLSPAEALRTVNQEFYEAYTNASLMATASVIRIDPATRLVEQANAGHPPTLLRIAGDWHRWKSSVPPIGVLPDTQPQLQSVSLNPGDLVISFSDGYSEIQTAQGLWGEQGIREAVPPSLLSADEAIQAIQAAAEQASSGDSIADDQTLLAIGFEGNHAVRTTLVIPATLAAMEQLTPLVDQVAAGASDRLRHQLRLALHELCVNIVEHAYKGTPGEIRLDAEFDAHLLRITVFDHGPNAYEKTEIIFPNPLVLPEGGWGMSILHRVMDEVHYRRSVSGNEWHLVKSW